VGRRMRQEAEGPDSKLDCPVCPTARNHNEQYGYEPNSDRYPTPRNVLPNPSTESSFERTPRHLYSSALIVFKSAGGILGRQVMATFSYLSLRQCSAMIQYAG
jgi:hypothetical protein